MISWLRKKAEEAVAQINPFDGGKTAQTVRQARQASPAVTQRAPAPQQQPSYGRGITGVVNRARDVVDANTAQDRYKRQLQNRPEVVKTYQDDIRNNLNQVKNTALGVKNEAINNPLSPVSVGKEVFFGSGPLKYAADAMSKGPLEKPTQGIRDVFDANTAKDFEKRNQAELQKAQQARNTGAIYEPKLNQNYMQQQESAGRRGRNNFGDQMMGGAAENINTLGAKLYETPETLRGTVAGLTNNQAALNASLQRQEQNRQKLYGSNKGGILNTGTIYDNPNQAQNLGVMDTTKRVGGGQLEAGSMVVGGGALPNIAKSGLKGIASYGGKTFLSGAMGTSGNEMSTNPNASLGDIIKQGVIGGTAGLALGVAGDGAVAGISKGATAVPKIVNKAGQSIDDVFNGVRQAYDGVNKQSGVNPFRQVATPEGIKMPMPKDVVGDNISSKYIVKNPDGSQYTKGEYHPDFATRNLSKLQKNAKEYNNNLYDQNIPIAKLDNQDVGVLKESGGKWGYFNPERSTNKQLTIDKLQMTPHQGEMTKATKWQTDKSGNPIMVKNRDIKNHPDVVYWSYGKTKYEPANTSTRYEGVVNLGYDKDYKPVYYTMDKIKESTLPAEQVKNYGVNSDPTIPNKQPNVKPWYKKQDGFVANPLNKGDDIAKSVDPLEALKAEARNYKSADEFIKAQGDSFYHTTPAKFDKFDKKYLGTNTDFDNARSGFYFTDNMEQIDDFKNVLKDGFGGGFVTEGRKKTAAELANYRTIEKIAKKENFYNFNYNAKDLTPKEARLFAEFADKKMGGLMDLDGQPVNAKNMSDKELGDFLKENVFVEDLDPDISFKPQFTENYLDDFTKFVKSKGYKGMITDYAQGKNEYLVFDPNALQTKQQLTDLYNQAKSPPIEKTPDVLMQEAKDIEATMGSGYLGTLPPSIAQRKMREFNKRLADINKQLNGNEPKLNGIERKITGTEPKLNQVEPKSTETVYKITARNQAGVIKQLRELSKKADSDGNTTLGDKLYKLADDVMYDRQYEYFGNKGYKHKLDKLVKTYAQAKSGAPIEPKQIKTRTIKTADGKNEYVAQLGENVTDRVGRVTGFKASSTSPQFKTEGEMNQWIKKNIELPAEKPAQGTPIEKTPNPTVTAIEEAGAKIRPVKQVPEKPPITPPEKPVKTPIDNPPEQFDELPVSHTKKVGLLDKAFRSTRSIIERQGKTGKELSGMLQKQRDVKELYVRDLEKRIPTVQKLKDKEYPNFVDATQGLAKPASAKIEKAVAEWKAIHPEIRDRAVKAGLDVGDLGETYYPHFIDYDKVFKDNNTYNQAINHIVKTGQAESREEAIKLLGYARDISRNRQFGNLEASRIVDIPFYDKSKQSLGVYLQGSADRITKTEIFGKNDEIALKKIANIGVEGGDTEAAKNAFDIAVGAKQYNPTSSKISGAVRKYTTVTRLGLGALTNVSQNVNTGVVTGHMRTLGAVMKQLSPKTRQWAADTGVISDAVLNDLKHGTGYETFGSTKAGKAVNLITAPGFKQVESLNRKIAATAGRDYGLRLAQKGDEKTLRKLGVTGEIKNNTLTDEQQIQVARKVVEKTQFKVDPQDLPGWADTPGGKLVAQFRTFSYNQGKFFSNEVLKPLAKGNVMPLARVLAALPVGYALYETRRVIDGRPEEENNVKKGLASFQKIGGAGLALDIYQQLNPVGSKYLPSDRRVSMATGALGGPTVGTLSNMVGSLSEAIQRKRTPDDESRLDGKIAVGNTGESYTDLTALSRFGLQQIPIVGTPMANRLIPYKKQSDADTGKTSNTATKNPGDGVAKASSSNQLTYDQAINIQKKEYGGKYADYTESEIKELAKTDGEAKQYLGSLEATKKAFGSDKELPEGLHPSAAKVYQTEHRLTDEGKTKWNAKESNDQYIKDTLKNWNNGEEVPVTNEIAKAWADYEKNRLEGKISNLEMNNEKKKVLRKAYSSVLSQDERGYYGVPDGDIISGLEQGLVTPESLQKALDVDALLVSKGLLSKSGFGKTVWNALGLNAPKSPTAKTTSSRTSRVKSTKVKTSKAKTGKAKTAKGGKYNYNLFMFGDAPTKSKSLRELVKKASAKA